MELSTEDSLRLHVLLKNIEAVRIDEQALVVYGLATQNGATREAKVALNPNCRPEQYLRRVREFFSGAILGSPGGYPLHLNRWTRMGQLGDGSLAELLLLGEPEAVAAVSCALGLTDELARRVWWIAPNSENARRMLERECIVNGTMGAILAQHLVDHLPFETDAHIMMETVRLVLQPGLLDDDVRQRLWDKGARQAAYRVGFLQATPDRLPLATDARADLAQYRAALTALAQTRNAIATTLLRALDNTGQRFIETVCALLPRIGDQDVVAAVLNVIGSYFAAANIGGEHPRDLQYIVTATESALDATEPNIAVREMLAALPPLRAEIAAVYTLAQISEKVALNVLAHSSASGTVLRKQLQPMMDMVTKQLRTLSHVS